MKLIAQFHQLSRKIYRRGAMVCYRKLFRECGENVVFDPLTSHISYATVSVGSNVFIAGKAWISSDNVPIVIRSNVMMGPGVTILAGTHKYDDEHRPMFFTKDKEPGLDQAIEIQDDVWLGANVTILNGVTIKRGCVIAAGSVVTRDTEELAIYAGAPAKKIKDRFKSALARENYLRQALNQ